MRRFRTRIPTDAGQSRQKLPLHITLPGLIQVEVLSKGIHGANLRLALLTDGEFFGESDLVSDKPSDVTVRTINVTGIRAATVSVPAGRSADAFADSSARHRFCRFTVHQPSSFSVNQPPDRAAITGTGCGDGRFPASGSAHAADRPGTAGV
ncbi:MAG: hypothetical protein ACKO2P_07405 [Planctomycetota bacterium]